MAIEPVVRTSIQKAVSEAGQPDALGRRLILWLDELSDGKTHLGSADDTPLRIEGLIEVVKVKDEEGA